jgi:two-component system OmpR family response regulator/two-component system copper resistance phosphate regulon response regulator CusR
MYDEGMLVTLVEDDPLIATAVVAAVSGAGHECSWVSDGAVAIEDDAVLASDLVVLDLMLPGADGLDVLRAARSRGVRTPVIVLTARGATADKLEAFAAGADDHLTKPFAMDELLARMEAVRRRASDRPPPQLTVVDLTLNLANKRLDIDGESIDLTPTECSILEMLMRFSGQVVTRKMLCEHVWGFDWDGPTNVIEVHITRLRAKIDGGREGSRIRTVRGRGYALTDG